VNATKDKLTKFNVFGKKYKRHFIVEDILKTLCVLSTYLYYCSNKQKYETLG